MRLKQALLCTLLFVIVRSNKYTSDYTCQHDGFSTSDGCQCTEYYGKTPGKKGNNDCSQIQCLNTGVLAPFDPDNEDQRCSCPPGFLGLHCEPVHCVAGDVKSFDEATHSRDVAIIITYNTQFQEQFTSKDKGPSIEKTICNAVYNQPDVDRKSRVHFWVMQNDILTDAEDCEYDFKFAIESCDDGKNGGYNCDAPLTTSTIIQALDEMGEDSRLIIISNLGIDDTDNEEGIEAIRKKAISMRIQMHSLVISPRDPNSNSIYFKGGLKALRELSESTLGFFINPFDASGGQKFGPDGITEILEKMMDVFFDYVVVDRVITTEDSCKQTTDFTSFRALDGNTEFWMTVISKKSPFNSYTTQWIGGPGTPVQSVSAGYFNAYILKVPNKGDLTSFKPYSMQGNKCAPTTVMVLAKSGHLARFAITNSDAFDATSPYAISGETNTLVGHFIQHYHEENLETLNLEFINGTGKPFDLNLDVKPSPRDCQYNAKFGDVSCEDGADTFIRVRDTIDGAAITIQNLYCSPKDQAQVSSSQFLRLAAQDEPAAPVCQPSNIEIKKDGRALIVSAHATETIFGLFNGNKDSAIRYLNDLNAIDDEKLYDQYIINIYNGKQTTNAKAFDNYPDFKEAMMSQWHTYKQKPESTTTTAAPTPVDPTATVPDPPLYFDKECTADVTAVYPLEDLTDINDPLINALPNSDILFIYDRAITISDEDERNILKNTYIKRLRLIVLLLGCSEGQEDFSDSNALKKWQSIASKTGGFAAHFMQPSDLNKFFASYVDWVQGQTASAIDNMAVESGYILTPVTSTPFQVKAGGNYTIIVNTVPTATDVTLSSGVSIVNPTVLGNSITKFDYTAEKDETLTVTVKPQQYYFYYASIRVLDLNEDYATIGFSKSKDHACLEKEYPDFNPSDPQFPLTVASADDSVNMTLFDETGTPFRSDAATDKDGNFLLPYNWRCNDNATTFYISADVTTADGRFTRVFATQCIGESDGAACINGENDKDDKWTCVCPHDYTGDFCEIPVCQNGGSVNSALECDCETNYSGFFCENYDGCKAEKDFMPDFKSIASTVIFLVERSAGVVAKLDEIDLKSFDEVRAAQYVVVQYGNETEADVVISTTDKTLLAKVLQGIKPILLPTGLGDATEAPSDEYFDAIPAIAAALNAQVTGSAQIFWFAETDKADNFVERLFDPIAHQRVSISALFTKPSVIDAPIHPVQLAGGNTFYFPDVPSNNYKEFFTNYVTALLQYQTTFEFRPNLLSTSMECNPTHTVNIDQSTQKLFVAANGDNLDITISTPGANLEGGAPVDIPGGKVYTFTKKNKVYTGAGTVTITIDKQKSEEAPIEAGLTTKAPRRLLCSSTVTAFNQIQVGYGFVKDDTDTTATITTKNREHLLVTYWTAEANAADPTPTPTAIITPMSRDEGFGNSTELYTTVRNGCSYSLSVPIDCEDGVDAIGVTITNWIVPAGDGNAVKVDKYIPVICPAGSCVHGNMTDSGDCACDPFWGGDYCDEELCKNGDIVGDDCVCFTGYSGDDCDVFINPKDRAGIAFLFIQDVCGKDEDLKDIAQSVFDNYRALLKDVDTFYLGTNDPDQSDVVLVKTAKDLTAAMTSNRATPGTCTASIGATLDSYYLTLRQPSASSSFMMKAAATDPAVGRARVAHVTTVAIDSDKGENLAKLSADFILDMEFIGITNKNELFQDPNSFKIFVGEFTQTYDPEVALLDLVNTFGSDTKPSIPSGDKIPRCIKDLQAAFVFHTDISSVPNMKDYRSKAQQVIQSVTKYFTIPDVKNIDIDDDTCEFNTDQMKDKTLFYGSIYANNSAIGVPTFCMSNMASYPGTIVTADYKQAAQVNLQAVVDSYTKWYATDIKMKCHCFDYANPNTTSIILWTPLSKTSLDTTTVSFDGFNKGGANFHHIVMPFGFNFNDSPLWNKLVPKEQWLSDASQANYDVDQIIQDIWTITCRLADKIEKDQTAEPYNPYTTRKPRVGEDTWWQEGANGESTDSPVGPR